MDLMENDWDTLNEVVDEVQSGLKTDEEISKFVVDESLTDLERAKVYLSGGHAVQQRAAIDFLPALYKRYKMQAHETVNKLLEKILKKSDNEEQNAVAEAFAIILRDKILSPKEMAECLLPTVVNAVSTNRDDNVVVAWLGVLIPMVPHLDAGVVEDQVLKLALKKGEVAETVQSRGVCCRILGTIAPRLPRQVILDTFFSKAMALCQDTDYQVRICMAEQLEPIARAVGGETTVDKVIPEAMELLNDEESSVQATALETCVAMMDMFPSEFRKEKVIPIVKDFVQSGDDAMVTCVARLFGPLMAAVVKDLNEAEVGEFCSSYCALSRDDDDELRLLCARNLPDLCTSLGPDAFVSGLYDPLMEMAQDRSAEVRAAVAERLLPLAKLLGKSRSSEHLKDTFLVLLEDGTEGVMRAVLADLVTMLGMLAPEAPAARERLFEELLAAVITAQGQIGARDWRLHVSLIEAFPEFPEYFPSDSVFEQVVPLCFGYMQSGAQPVKEASARAVCVLMRRCRRQSHRREICHRIVRELGRGASFWDRALYVTCCNHIMSLCSSRFFKEMMMDCAFDALQDPVANVRMVAVTMLPTLKKSIKLPDDVDTLERLNNFFNTLQNDKDRDVLLALDSVEREFKSAASQQTGRAGPLTEWQKADKRKEEEESEMLVREAEDNKRRFEDKQKRELQRHISDTGMGARVGMRQASGTLRHPGGAVKPISMVLDDGSKAGAKARGPRAAPSFPPRPAGRPTSSTGSGGVRDGGDLGKSPRFPGGGGGSSAGGPFGRTGARGSPAGTPEKGERGAAAGGAGVRRALSGGSNGRTAAVSTAPATRPGVGAARRAPGSTPGVTGGGVPSGTRRSSTGSKS